MWVMFIPELFNRLRSAASTGVRGGNDLPPARGGWGDTALPWCRVERLERRTFLAAQPLATDDPTAADVPRHAHAPPPTRPPAGPDPQVLSSDPPDGATGVARDASVTMEVYLPNGGIDQLTVNPATVYIVRVSDGERVPANPGTS